MISNYCVFSSLIYQLILQDGAKTLEEIESGLIGDSDLVPVPSVKATPGVLTVEELERRLRGEDVPSNSEVRDLVDSSNFESSLHQDRNVNPVCSSFRLCVSPGYCFCLGIWDLTKVTIKNIDSPRFQI